MLPENPKHAADPQRVQHEMFTSWGTHGYVPAQQVFQDAGLATFLDAVLEGYHATVFAYGRGQPRGGELCIATDGFCALRFVECLAEWIIRDVI